MRRFLFILLPTIFLNSARADVAVLTQHNDLSRTGANLQETILNVTNVNTNTFGLLFTRAVDDQIYAQPLIMTNVSIPGKGTHNIVIVATVNDSVYAFDADDPRVKAPYWHVNFLGPKIVPPRNTDMNAPGGPCDGFSDKYQDFSGNIGIVGTPVIDPISKTIYLVARTKKVGLLKDSFVQQLHALDIATGSERPNSPVTITANYPSNGSGNTSGFIIFDPQRQNQRAGLALVNGIVYVCWASHCDLGPYHGWLIGYDASTLKRTVVYNTTPEGNAGGIWMSGQAPSADEKGNLYISVGNGSVGTGGNRRNPVNRGESFLKLTRTASGDSMYVTSWFTPYNWQDLEDGDIDLGSTGLLLIPGTTLAFGGSKEGKVYLVNRDHMGGLSHTDADTNVVQSFQVTAIVAPNNIHGAPIWWDGTDGSYVYVWGETDYLHQYKFDRKAGKFLLPNFARNATPAPEGMPGGMLSLSANGTNAGTGIVWASHPFSGDANRQVRPGILHAYHAQNVGIELWNSEQNSKRDSVGKFAKFCPPTVANGKVYLATFSNQLNIYGLLSASTKAK